jgi:hypothetical protein
MRSAKVFFAGALRESFCRHPRTRTDSKMNAPPKLAYTVEEGMTALGIGRTKFYELARSGKIDLRKVGGRTVATAASLHRLVEEAERA